MAKMKWKSKEQLEEERLQAEYEASLPSETEVLEAKLKLMEQRNDMLEDALLEMAMEVYK